MKFLAALVFICLASCATPSKNWDTPVPDASSNIADEHSRFHPDTNGSMGSGHSGMTDEEILELAKPKKKTSTRFSGSLTLGIGGRF